MPRPSKNSLAFDDRAIKAARFADGRERPIKGVPGLYLRLAKSDTGTYVFRYLARGRQRRVVIGDRRVVPKEEARARATDLARAVWRGADPAIGQQRNGSLTLRRLMEEFMEKADRPGERTKSDYREALERDVLKSLGSVTAEDITGTQIARVLEHVESRPPAYVDRKKWHPPKDYKGTNAAHKARCALGSIYRWGVKRQLIPTSPCMGLGYIQRPVARERKVTDAELAELWNALDIVTGMSIPMRSLIRLVILTGQRSSEVAGARASELELNGAKPRWAISAGRMKRKRSQTIALSRQAAKIFSKVLEGSSSELVFPADEQRSERRLEGSRPRKPHIHGESVSKAMTRLCAHAGLHNLRAHDMRKALATWSSDNGILPHVIDYILHHAPRTTTGAHYDFSTMDPLVRPALQLWADHIEEVATSHRNGRAMLTDETTEAAVNQWTAECR